MAPGHPALFGVGPLFGCGWRGGGEGSAKRRDSGIAFEGSDSRSFRRDRCGAVRWAFGCRLMNHTPADMDCSSSSAVEIYNQPSTLATGIQRSEKAEVPEVIGRCWSCVRGLRISVRSRFLEVSKALSSQWAGDTSWTCLMHSGPQHDDASCLQCCCES